MLLSGQPIPLRLRQHMPLMLVAVHLLMPPGAEAEEDTRKRVVRKTSVRPALRLLEQPDRELAHQPERVMDTLGFRKGDAIADVGAGTGFFAVRFARRVGNEGTVYAVEIKDELLSFMSERKNRDGINNLVLVKSSQNSPNLTDRCCDKALVIDTYNHFADPVLFMTNLRTAMKPGSVVAIINRYDFTIKRPGKRLATVSEVTDEMQRAGFMLKESHDFLKDRYFLVFVPRE